MGNIESRSPVFFVKFGQLVSHRCPKVCIQVAEWFIKKVNGGVAGKETPKGNTLALATG